VLSVFAAIVRRLKGRMQPEVPKVLTAVFEPTLQVRGVVCVCVCVWGAQSRALGLACAAFQGHGSTQAAADTHTRTCPHAHTHARIADDHGQL
jgi:hypothetical protein